MPPRRSDRFVAVTRCTTIVTFVGVNPSIHSGEIDGAAAADALPERIDQKVGWVREGAGDRFADIEINAWLAVVELTDDTRGHAEMIAPLFETDADSLLASPMTLIGSIAEMAERLEQRRERWSYSYHVIPGEQARSLAPLVASLAGC